MSKYTDYLNEKFETSTDEITILTDFLKRTDLRLRI